MSHGAGSQNLSLEWPSVWARKSFGKTALANLLHMLLQRRFHESAPHGGVFGKTASANLLHALLQERFHQSASHGGVFGKTGLANLLHALLQGRCHQSASRGGVCGKTALANLLHALLQFSGRPMVWWSFAVLWYICLQPSCGIFLSRRPAVCLYPNVLSYIFLSRRVVYLSPAVL